MLLTARSAILAKKLPPVYCFLSKTLYVAFLSNGAERFLSKSLYVATFFSYVPFSYARGAFCLKPYMLLSCFFSYVFRLVVVVVAVGR